jgi:hypothetical protein
MRKVGDFYVAHCTLRASSRGARRDEWRGAVYMKASLREGTTINRQQFAFVIRRDAPGRLNSSGAAAY